jgi:TetR/AcrR family transcriptional regulator, transcriptional repressor of bet genes
MPRIGAEPERRKALIHAAIEMIGEQGSLDVSVKDIAKQAGMSSALAFHYFGDKDEIIIQTMRHLLREFSTSVVRELRLANQPNERIDAIIRASFSLDQFERKTVAAWLVFYLKSYSSAQAARLLGIYTSRLKSNLVHAFRAFLPEKEAQRTADGLGALIDGIYIRQALAESDSAGAISLCRAYVRATCNISLPNHGVH